MSARPSLLLASAITAALNVAIVAPAGCAESGARALNLEAQGEGGAGPSPLDGLQAIAIEPRAATLSLAYASPIVPATQAFKATGTFADGTKRDITANLAWRIADGDDAPVTVSGGSFSAGVPGQFTIVASGGPASANASATVKLTGSVMLPNAPADIAPKLDASPSGSTPTIAYPLDGALFPRGLASPSFQMQRGNGTQTLGRLEVTGDLIDLRVYGTCDDLAPSVTPGCALTLTPDLELLLAGASTGDAMTERVRLAASDGSKLGESAPVDVRWTFSRLEGALYYWRTLNHETATAISRFDLSTPGAPPEDFFVNDPDSPPIQGQQHPCVGCHAITPDGAKMALTFGGSIPSAFGLLDIASKKFIASKTSEPNGFATETAFSADSERLINQFRGQLVLRAADATLATIGDPLFSSVGEKLASPFWSPDGKKIAFVGWQPGQNGASDSVTGDLVRGGQIYISDSDGKAPTGSPKLLVPRAAGKTQTYPAISDDSALVVYTETSCDGPPTPGPYGNDPCDGYDDPSARVKAIRSDGSGAPIDLVRANGGSSGQGGPALTWANSWPRFGPTHATFRGKKLYWITFSSRRPYGLVLAGSTNGSTKPQLWIAGVALSPGADPLAGDPSFAPVWMPGQNNDLSAPTGNHVPQWVTKFVQVIK